MQLLKGMVGCFVSSAYLKLFGLVYALFTGAFVSKKLYWRQERQKKRGQAKEVMHLCVRLVASQAVLRSCRVMFTQWFRCKSEKNHNPQFKSLTASHMSCQLAETVSLIVVQFSMRS